MTPGQPDFVWGDEEDGVLAIKHGDEILYVSLYWRARNAINFLARVHYITPRVDHIAVVRGRRQFEPSGQILVAARLGELRLRQRRACSIPATCIPRTPARNCPSPKFPPGVKFKPGDESPTRAEPSSTRCATALI